MEESSLEKIIKQDISEIFTDPAEKNKIEVEYTELIRHFLRNQFGLDNFKVA